MDKKIKILSLVNPGGSKYFRCVLPLDLLDKEKYEVVFLNENFILESIVKDIDYLYIHWVQRTNCVYLSLWKEKYGFKIIQDIDDYWALPFNHYIYSKIDAAKKQLFDQLILADIVLCSTPYLLNKCLEFNDNCHLRENYIPIGYQQFQPEYIPVQNRKPTIGICGSLSHYDDWMSIRNQLKRIQSFKSEFDFVVAGYADENPTSKEKWDKIVNLFPNPKVFRHLPVNQYINFYKHIDILLAPLEINEFNKSKSNLKILESSVKSTITISNNLYKEKGIEDYLSTEDKSYFEHISSLRDLEYLNHLKKQFQNRLIEKNKELQTNNQLNNFLI
jgi:hypothetical protein